MAAFFISKLNEPPLYCHPELASGSILDVNN